MRWMLVTGSLGHIVIFHFWFLFCISLANLPGCLTAPVGLYNVIITNRSDDKTLEITQVLIM